MSRRESCVWHPMPEEVRRSSVQSRRASLAAGRRKSQQANGNQPDWEVEAPLTPPPADDYSPRQVAAAPVSAAAAATTAHSVPAAEETAPAPFKQARQQSTESEQNEEESAAAGESVRQQSVAVDEEQYPEEAAAATAADALDAEEIDDDEEEVLAGMSCGDGMATHESERRRTRHTIRFRGKKWQRAVASFPDKITASFLKDIWEAAKVKEGDAVSVKVAWVDEMMVATFVLVHTKGLKKRQMEVHRLLAEYPFPHTCALYPHD